MFLPTATLFETGGTLAASDGRLQRAEPVQAPGLSVLADGAGDHPPRDYARPLPGTDPAPAAFWCDRLGRALSLELPRHPLAEALAAHPVLAGLDPAQLPAEGQRPTYPGREPAAPEPAAEGLAVVFETPFFGDELSRYAPLVADKTGPAVALLHPDDAAGLNLADGATVALDCGDAPATAAVRLHPGVARDVVVVPRLPRFDALPPNLGPCGLRRRETP